VPEADGPIRDGGGCRLGVTRKALSELLNGHSGVSPEMALRLAAAGWSTAETWLQMQLAYDLWQVRKPHRRFAR